MDVSPSTVTRLNDRSATCPVISCNAGPAIAASQHRKASMVAISGLIIPEPLAMPVIVTGLPATSIRALSPLGAVSVVMMACAASAQPAGDSFGTACSIAERIASTGNRSPMTPVENGSTDSPEQSEPRHRATCSQSLVASSRPLAPVAALALPLLISNARRLPVRIRSSAMITGGARNAFCVKTPATADSRASSMTARSSRCRCLMPAQAVARRTPATGASSPSGGRFTAMKPSESSARRTGPNPGCAGFDG